MPTSEAIGVPTAGGDLFLKIRRGPVSEAGLTVPQVLAKHGIGHLIAPIPTVEGRLCDGDDVTFILYPFVEGVSGGRDGMSPALWKELGVTVRSFHDLRPDHQLTSLLRTEAFVPATVGLLRDVEQRLDTTGAGRGPARACERVAPSPRADRSARCANGAAGPWRAGPCRARRGLPRRYPRVERHGAARRRLRHRRLG